MKRILMIATLCSLPVAASAAVAPASRSMGQAPAVEKQVQVADYYKGKKHCYTRGSATICN